ncbi:2-C-methyl-D-erythritol 4-phosphate cytidylyltransferase [Rosenbergiella australiborealis]|uniref:2-C-methyl-D-erythritol 4-phosphate cytidylyltransferase n=1 Tax=Rosenbergiella australiborealis TaxID=1544696 RepID=A0ABS5T8E1_9GAMM|nr:2-C-methyl-D-erythritol 4-phosphate cytidylyltransferase [Rosenbergiella australiborealis]MBT0727983.1 2-C-methyl-D-erythritol 4-phosphate cytidylyltransferase [Rosenbergiella australiborealis]
MKTTLSTAGIIAVVPAAGIGSRMQSSCPKQYLSIGSKTLLEHSIAALFQHPLITKVIVALHPDDDHFTSLPIANDPRISYVVGGATRAESVLAGLAAIAPQASQWVVVHDAARPCLTKDDLARLLALTTHSKVGGLLATPVKDTMKRAIVGESRVAHSVERADLWHALTPQLFPLELLRECLQQALYQGKAITDEASALEHCGYHPELVDGRSDNIKVTRPEDLALAEFYLSQKNQ